MEGIMFAMKRVFRKFPGFEEADRHDIQYYINLSVEERQAIARELKRRAFGDKNPDVREYHRRK
jgi:hypothetical protein